MNKYEEALETIQKYMEIRNEGPKVANITLANLHKICGVLFMFSREKDYALSAVKNFKDAIELYNSLGIADGSAVCMLGTL